MSLVRVQGVRHRFAQAADAIELAFPDFDLAAGEHAALLGPSGSGKSTLLHLLAGLLTPTAGTIVVPGRDLTRATEAERDHYRATTVGYVFQDFNLIDGYSAVENVVVGLGLAGVAARERPERARQALERLGLGDRARHTPRKLSTGERQRVALARAVAHRPALLLADEPTAHLDRTRAEAALGLLRSTAQEMGAILLVATHDPWVYERFERRIEVRP